MATARLIQGAEWHLCREKKRPVFCCMEAPLNQRLSWLMTCSNGGFHGRSCQRVRALVGGDGGSSGGGLAPGGVRQCCGKGMHAGFEHGT